MRRDNFHTNYKRYTLHFTLLFSLIVIFLTILLFPIKQNGIIKNLFTWETITATDIVSLSPIFILGDRDEKNSISIAPNLDKYTRDVSSTEIIVLLRHPLERRFGKIYTKWRFAFVHWIYYIVVPSVLIAFFGLFIHRKYIYSRQAGELGVINRKE